MKAARVSMLSLVCLFGCVHKPPTTSGAERKRVPINSAEQQTRLAFCADLGIAAASSREESPASAPVVPVVMELSPAPSTLPACAPPTKASSYVMRVPASKSPLFRPSAEQVSELAPYLSSASRVEIRAPGSVAEEKLSFQRASAARDFLLKQGVPASRIWLQVSPPVPTAPGEEALVVGVEIEVKGGE